MEKSHLLSLARVGAETRLQALQGEIAAILRQFPELRGGRGPAGAGAAPARRRRRNRMSTEQRQVVSERMKKYWAGRRKAKKEARGA